ncbi:MAG: hypothetical protein EOM91_01645 [Sphingobacteriia bacterium]|nr:hypothetical protein [Sphingobacteriia bacterium]NCC38806.1 hypothetical protein [Gammaproteobacteria bacterium]
MSDSPRLIFVYNADSGLFNALADIGHKLFSPSTYPCSLCAITHGVLAERTQWRDFIASLGVSCEFLHRDQLSPRLVHLTATFPAIFSQHGEHVCVCADAAAIGACAGLHELQALILRDCLADPPPADAGALA